ncbi:MAG: HEAT repeat domain-containing protein [Phycisphaerae bacterium]|nr:HEAT repeat domain-containing protein [Phycisphaerae bacterium]
MSSQMGMRRARRRSGLGPRARRAGAAWLAILAGLAAPAWAASDDHSCGACLRARQEMAGWLAGRQPADRSGQVDPATGRDLRNYPPHAPADFVRMELDLDIPDMNAKRLSGVCTYVIVPRVPIAVLTLRAGPPSSMKIGMVAVDGDATAARAKHEGELLALALGRPLAAGVEARVSIAYTLDAPPEGMTWTPESPAWPGRAAQIHTQGQPESNHYWFPCHDFPNERMAQVIRASVPAGYWVSSNGALTGRRSADGREVFEWRLDRPHAAYLASLVVGKFDRVELPAVPAGGGGGGEGGASVPLEVLAPVGLGKRVEQTYGRTGAMVRLFSDLTGTPYPWPRYAQVIVHDFGAGGMENTSATTMFDTAILDETALLDGDLDGLIAHELAHQWFGDLVTCNSWEHIWLNEGFATYFTHLWFDHRDGEDAYLSALYDTRRGLIGSDPCDPAPAPNRPGMVSKEYGHPWEVFRRGANPYPKGAFILHMLRERLGEAPFLAGLRDYLHRHAYETVETHDLRKALERASGDRLEGFFQQWCERPGVPRVRVTPTWDAAARRLTVKVEQTQPIDGYNPAFDLTIPVSVRCGREWFRLTVRTAERAGEASVELPAEPSIVAVDPRASVLADLRVEQAESRWLEQLTAGPTVASRLQAIAAVAERSGSAQAARVLEGVASDPGAARPVRAAALAGLARLGRGETLLALAGAPPEEAPLRTALVQSLADAAAVDGAIRPRAGELALAWLKQDRSYGVRSAAARAAGALRPEGAAAALAAACGVNSQHDQIRQAAIEALATLDDPAGLPAVLAATQSGVPSRTRAVAIKAAARLLRHDPPRVLAVLAASAEDASDRVRRSAAEALADTGDACAKPIIDALAASGSAAERAGAKDWLRRFAEASARQAAVPPLPPLPPTPPSEPAVATQPGIIDLVPVPTPAGEQVPVIVREEAKKPAPTPPPPPAPQPGKRKQGFTGGIPVPTSPPSPK